EHDAREVVGDNGEEADPADREERAADLAEAEIPHEHRTEKNAEDRNGNSGALHRRASQPWRDKRRLLSAASAGSLLAKLRLPEVFPTSDRSWPIGCPRQRVGKQCFSKNGFTSHTQ